MKKLLALVLTLCIVLSLCACAPKNYTVEITVKDMGVITLELDASAAPKTVENFVSLAKSGFYDGLTFHRVQEGFMIQGGCPLGTGTGSAGHSIKGEFSSNGVKNPISHKRGVISMARSMDPDSASCQFFIMHQDTPSLDGQYAAFGHVTSGMEIVDMIAERVPVTNPITCIVAPEHQPVIETITVK